MTASLAWKNAVHDRRRTIAATAGVAFAILLQFMQLGFYSACKTSSTMVYDSLDFDAVLVSTRYMHLRQSGTIPRARLYQARGVIGVESATPLYVTSGFWRNVATHVRREILILGINPSDQPFQVAAMNQQLDQLRTPDSAIIDRKARPIIGPHSVGTVTELNGQRIKVIADYKRGCGLIADGSVLVSDLTMSRLLGAPLTEVQLVLVRFANSSDAIQVVHELRAALPEDTQVWSRDELQNYEQYFFMNIKPVGFMFTSGMFVGFVVGAVILYQVLSADVAKHIPQYATLKAIGYGPSYLYRLVITQGFVFALLGFVPALLLSFGLYAIVEHFADLPMQLSLDRIATVLASSVGMCSLAGLLAIRKVNSADPADLF